jgi:hypothetical protein
VRKRQKRKRRRSRRFSPAESLRRRSRTSCGRYPADGGIKTDDEPKEEQKILIEGLQFLGINADIIKGVVLLLPEKWQIAEMASYLLNNKNANESDILEEAIRISEMEED